MADALALLVAKRLRFRRRSLDLTQQELGAACGMSGQMISRYERGTAVIPAAALYMLAQALDVPTSYFFEGFAEAEDRGAWPSTPLPEVSPESKKLDGHG